MAVLLLIGFVLPSACNCIFGYSTVVQLAESVVFALLPVCIILRLPWKIARMVFFTLIFVGVVFEMAHVMVYRGDLATAGYVRSLFMTTPYEAEGALGRVIKQHCAEIILIAIYYCLTVICIFLWDYPTEVAKRTTRVTMAATIVIILAGRLTTKDYMRKHVLYCPPYNIFCHFAEAARQTRERDKLVATVPDKRTITVRTAPRESPNEAIYMIIIDESLRADRLSLNGYMRSTTPRLETLDNLVNYTNYYATGVFTMYAVPMLLTRATPAEFSLNYTDITIQEVFRQAGYQTVWLTNSAQLVNDGVSGYIARGADTIINVSRDMEMADAVQSLLRNDKKIFAVLHLWGSHQFYYNESPATSRYSPDVLSTDAVIGDDIYNNSYDNTVLYTDSLLFALNRIMCEYEGEAAAMFLSDHGEGPIGKYGGAHGYTRPHKSEYHVPLLIWYNAEYASAYKQKTDNLSKHKDAPVSADHVFWSALDMADIQIDSTLQKDGMSVFGDTLLPHRRTLLLSDGRSVMMLD